ncbi:MAG: tRNA lysidine(34) synthetase TilS [Longimicrobiales bacterium]
MSSKPFDVESFSRQFSGSARAAPWGAGDGVVVGVSGGVDSMTLLYLLRFEVRLPGKRIHVAHVDHGMRPDSQADAAWLSGVCRAWGVPFHVRASVPPIRTEAQGREARYGFFHELAAQVRATSILTGHNADDQAETVLFRIARGAGPAGLAGVQAEWPTGVARPLLHLWRRDIQGFAEARGVPSREDPTNEALTWSRNRLRHEVLPVLEEVVPGASKALAQLGRMAESERTAMSQLTDALLDQLQGESGDGGQFDALTLAALSDPVLTQLVRRMADRMGVSVGRRATVSAVRFMRDGRSGQQIDLAEGLILDRSFGHIRFRERPEAGPGDSRRTGAGEGNGEGGLVVNGPDGGGHFKVGRGFVEVGWGSQPLEDFPYRTSFPRSRVSLPLTVRPWQAGDRVRMTYGTKKVKKILAEKRVPHTERAQLPVVANSEGVVVWVPGVVPPAASGADAEGERLYVGIRYLPEGNQS